MPQSGSTVDMNAALAPGMAGANDLNSMIVNALNYWNNLVPENVDPLDDSKVSAAAAITLLNQLSAYLANPSGGIAPPQ